LRVGKESTREPRGCGARGRLCAETPLGLAATTRKAKVGTLVSSTGFRNPAQLQDRRHGGRDQRRQAVLVLGAGWYEPEYRGYGFPFEKPVGHFEEALKIIRPLLGEGQADFSGEYHEAFECELRARSADVAPHHRARRHVERLARLRAQPPGPDPTPARRRGRRLRKGRPGPVPLGRTAGMLVDVGFGSLQPLEGSPEEVAESLLGFAREGISPLQVWLAPNTLAGVEAFAPVLELLDGNARRAA
jgi:alkanesulfonate monooxygenase SsuD/methylene tetrahydromethanopterin reductase-like flavin-dependent oxidoreductase (luciferase family)